MLARLLYLCKYVTIDAINNYNVFKMKKKIICQYSVVTMNLKIMFNAYIYEGLVYLAVFSNNNSQVGKYSYAVALSWSKFLLCNLL